MDGKDMRELAESALGRAGIAAASPEAGRRLALYLKEVDYWSGKIHLVGKGRLGSSLELLVFDSLALLKAAEERGLAAGRVADIGSGAGFPGLVWKIVRPGLDLTLFERRLKPQLFLERIVTQLGLEGIAVVGEDAAKCSETGAFDLVVSKAAGRLGDMLPLAGALLGSKGAYVTIKGGAWKSEMPERSRSAMHLEAAIELPEKRGTALIFRKDAPS